MDVKVTRTGVLGETYIYVYVRLIPFCIEAPNGWEKSAYRGFNDLYKRVKIGARCTRRGFYKLMSKLSSEADELESMAYIVKEQQQEVRRWAKEYCEKRNIKVEIT